MPKIKNLFVHHKLFFVYLFLFFIVAFVDLFNIDRRLYFSICSFANPVTKCPCATFYDIPIWNVYLSLAILAALYHVHGEIRTSNKHLSSRKD